MSEGKEGLRFLTADELVLVSGDLREFPISHPRVRFATSRPVLFWHKPDESFLLLSREDAVLLGWEAVAFRFDVDAFLRSLRAEVVPPGVEPNRPAVVVDDHGVVLGAWVEPEADRSLSYRQRSFEDLDMVTTDRSGRAADLSLGFPAGAAEEPLEERGEPVIRRTPHLGAPEALPTAPGSLIEVVVWTNARPFREAEEGADVVVDAPPEVTKIELDVTLSISDHFELEGEATQRLTIRRDEDDSRPLVFRLRVGESPPERTAGICAMFSYRRRPCGHVTRAWAWPNGHPVATAAPAHTALSAGMSVHVGSEPPDLAVYVTAPVNDGIHFNCAVETTLVSGFAKPTPREFGLRERAPDLVAEQLERVSDASLDAADRREALEEAGYAFWEAAPPVFKEAIWKLVDEDRRPRSIYIASAEPSLPWELMIPTRHDGKEPRELRPLGVEFAIGRWTRGDAVSPPQRIPVRNSFVIAPRYDVDAFDSSEEVGFVKRCLNGIQVEEATKRALDRLFADHHASLLHFVCHGAEGVANDEAIYLDDDEVLRSDALRPLRGFKALCRARAPLVFINACDAGCGNPALAGGAGFPRAFGDIGARAVLAPLWPVANELATKVATTVYGEALRPGAEPVAEILRTIRARAYEEDDLDTYAAYAFFGDPRARIELVTE